MYQQTSLLAYQSVEPTLGERQRQILRLFELHAGASDWASGLTNAEISAEIHWEINRVTPRTNELRKLGLLELATQRKDRITGSTANAWRLKKSGRLL